MLNLARAEMKVGRAAAAAAAAAAADQRIAERNERFRLIANRDVAQHRLTLPVGSQRRQDTTAEIQRLTSMAATSEKEKSLAGAAKQRDKSAAAAAAENAVRRSTAAAAAKHQQQVQLASCAESTPR